MASLQATSVECDMANSSTAWLGTTLPTLAPGQFYELIEAGSLRPASLQGESYTVQARFLACTHLADGTVSSQAHPIECDVDMYRAGLLIPGSRWTADGHLLALQKETLPENYRQLSIDAGRQLVRKLHHVFPSFPRPSQLKHFGLHGWYLVIDTAEEQVLIPCFELARVYYYSTGKRIISFCLSRLALNRICWPLASPRDTHEQSAHFCIAAQSVYSEEIRLFAEMLFNPLCCQTIQRAHARLAQEWSEQRLQPLKPAPWLRLDWCFGRTISVRAVGHAFAWQEKAYFLVQSLEPGENWFCYKSVIYHSLQYSIHRFAKNPFPETVSVTPVAQRLLSGYGTPKGAQTAIEKAMNRLSTQYNSMFPPIYRGFPWGVVEPEKRVDIPYPTLESIGPYLWESCPGYKDTTDSRSRSSLATEEPVFGQLLAKLAQLVDCIQPIEINNPDQTHGRGLSSFPLGSLPSALTHLPSRRLRPIGIVQVQRGRGFYYLIYMSFQKQIILLYDRQLCAMSEEALAEFLYVSSYNPGLWEYEVEERFPTGEITSTSITRPLASPAELCAWCLLKMKAGIRLWNAYKLLAVAVNSGKISLEKHFDDHEENLFYIASRLLRKGQIRFAGDKMLERPLR